MIRFIHFILTVLLLSTVATGAAAQDRTAYSRGDFDVLHGGTSGAKAAALDTVILIGPWGSGASFNGQFETSGGDPSWQGWTHRDLTRRTGDIWHVDTYHVVSGARSAWCGESDYASCEAGDPAGGYGNNYYELLVWRATVDDPSLPTTVSVTATVNHDVELVYDSCNLGYYKADDSIAYLWSTDGEGAQVPVAGSVTYQPGEYVGPAADEVRIAWLVVSDGVYSDADCLAPSAGAMQVDDVTVTLVHDGVTTRTFDDFEDGTLGNWSVEHQIGVGDYAHLLSALGDVDACASNFSPQAVFIADELMYTERGLPTQLCETWCYGPGGYIVPTRGGAAGPGFHFDNAVESPVIDWPADYVGAGFEFDVYRHEDLSHDSPGVFYTWSIRSAAAGQDIADAVYRGRNYLYYGGPEYVRTGDANVSDLLVGQPARVQLEFRVLELGYVWGWDGDDGTPAPYFDNVRLVAFPVEGPSLQARSIDLAQDAFPADGMLHEYPALDRNDVRFDMARNISPSVDLRNDPGDSIVVTIEPGGDGAELVEFDIDATVTAPRLHFVLSANPEYGPELRLGIGPFTCDSEGSVVLAGRITSIDGSVVTGYVEGAYAEANGVPSPSRWMFDLPDEDFLYPGDALHYYIEAWDRQGGVYRSATLPADLSGFGDFGDFRAYETAFTVYALPSIDGFYYNWPGILLWDDSGDPEIREAWLDAAYHAGASHWPLDVFTTRGPSSGVGNGLGGRATLEQIENYQIIVYCSGEQQTYTMTPPDFYADAGDDIGLIRAWLELGNRRMLAAGDDLVNDLWMNSSAGQDLVSDWFGVALQADDARPLLGGDVAPEVVPTTGGDLEISIPWVAMGGCPSLNRFDAVIVEYGELLAYFNDGSSNLSACTLMSGPDGSRVVSLPYDLAFVGTPPGSSGNARDELFRQIMFYLGAPRWGGASPPSAPFMAGAYPNPFNPSTRIEYSLPRAGNLRIKVFDVRGQLVCTLIDEPVAAGSGHVDWNGTDDSGKSVASGVYFYEARTEREAHIDKLMLVK